MTRWVVTVYDAEGTAVEVIELETAASAEIARAEALQRFAAAHPEADLDLFTSRAYARPRA